MSEGQYSRRLIRGVLAAWTLVFTACGDSTQHTTSYATASEALADGGVERGWLPAEMPASAFDIAESHELDSNTGCGSFSFSAEDTDVFRAKLRPALPSHREKFDDHEKLQGDGYSFYVVPEFVLAVNWQSRHGHFLLVKENDPTTHQ